MVVHRPPGRMRVERASDGCHFACLCRGQDLVTPAELKGIERILRCTKQQRKGMLGIMGQTMGLQMQGSDDDDDDDDDDVPTTLSRERPHSERVAHHHPATLLPVANCVRFKKSHCFRARVPMREVCGARLVTVDFPRPHADLPPHREGPRGGRVRALGQKGEGADVDEPPPPFIAGDPPRYSDRARPGTFEYDGGAPDLEPLGILVLEFATRGARHASFAVTKLYPRSASARKRVLCADWTPGNILSDATRHYIIGDKSEMVELAKSLATSSKRLAALLRPEIASATAPSPPASERRSKRQKNSAAPPTGGATTTAPSLTFVEQLVCQLRNTLGGEKSTLLPERTELVRSLQSLAARVVSPLPGDDAAMEEAGAAAAAAGSAAAAAAAAASQHGFRTKSEVHAFLRRAGVERPEQVNPCLKAGLMNGNIPVAPHLIAVADSSSFLETVLLEAPCNSCAAPLTCTVRDALWQPSSGGHDYCDGNQGGAVQCQDCEGHYVSRLCLEPQQRGLESGKFHNHCEQCPRFGTCIGDYRQAHCSRCKDHFFMGLSGFRCPCRDGGVGGIREDEVSDGYSEDSSETEADEVDS
eukprot:SAG25_NODE_1439_length_3023_cov_1.781806_3_plen_586_part_01